MTNSIVTPLLLSLTLMLPGAAAAVAPCSGQITELQQTLRHDAGEAPPFSGTASQSIDAQLSRQPTPASIQQAEEGERAQVIDTLVQAQTLSAEGREQACRAAIAKAKLLLDP